MGLDPPRLERVDAAGTTMSDELLSVRAAELYYDDVKTQDEIGSLLGITRWKVGRLLAQARESGIIRIEIVHPRARRLSLERELRERFGLKDAIVVPVPSDGSTLQARVAEAAADYLQVLRPVPRTLGVSWGRTLDEIAERLPLGWSRGVDVVQINGGVSLNRRSSTAAATAVTIARKGGELEHAGASAYLFSAGAADESSVLVDSGYLSPGDVAELVRKGAVGDIVGRYIDADGRIVDRDLDERTVGLGLDALRSAATSIAVVAGRAKHHVARAIVGSALCTILVTDEETAAALLEEKRP
jgi:deoxyribonucleoside regulator